MKEALYFGCRDSSGHFAHSKSGSPTLNIAKHYHGFPWTLRHLDGGLLGNGKVSDNVTGQVRWTHGGANRNWFAFYWWDRSGDSRPGSNSGFYVKGFESGQASEAFAFARQEWPTIVARQRKPLVLDTKT